MDKARMDKAKRKRIKRYLTWLCIAAVVAGLTVMPLMAKKEAETDGPVASILSVQPEKGDISLELRGGGTLEAQGAMDVKIPAEVKITGFLVKNGDTVKAGTPVAAVDKVSVMTAITGVSETLQYLEAQLEDARDEEVEDAITATAGGRVKILYGKAGEQVEAVMLRDGCLAVLSLDGLMAVEVPSEAAVTIGEDISVTMENGKTVTGRIASKLDGIVTVTVEDKGYAPGQAVQVEGLGSGTLQIHNAWRVTAYSGTISKVHVQEEKELSSGAKLFTLKDTDYSGQLQRRANQHREYEALLQTLMKMYESGVILAPCDGVVSGVDENSAHLLSAGEENWNAAPLADTGEGWRIILLGDTTPPDPAYPDCTGTAACTASQHSPNIDHACIHALSAAVDCPAAVHDSGCIEACQKADTCPASVHYKDCIRGCTKAETCPSGKHYDDCLTRCISSDGSKDCPGGAHKTSCIERCVKASTEGVCDADAHHHYEACIGSCVSAKDGSTDCGAYYHKSGCWYQDAVLEAVVVKVRDSAAVSGELLGNTDGQIFTGSSLGALRQQVDGVFNSMTFPNDVTIPTIKAGSFQKDDYVLVVNLYKAGTLVKSDVTMYQEAQSSGNNQPGFNWGFGTGGFGNRGFSGFTGGTGETEDEGLYDLEGEILLTVTPQDTLTVTITVDEHDIAKVTEGMKAMITVGALREGTFPAVVTKVGISGANSGGSSKFAVELTATEGAGDALVGMSVDARIPLETKADVLTIPVAALMEKGGRTFVYTALDGKTGEPASLVEVKTGASDGDRVEILSGLTAGSVVYYKYYDQVEENDSAEQSRFSFG